MSDQHFSDFITKSLDYCKNKGSLADVIEILSIVVENNQNNEIESNIADLLWFIDTMLTDSYNEKIKDNFINIIRACEKNIPLNVSFLKDRLGDEILESLRLITSKQQYVARYVKTKTRVFYKQNKFNLIREANEGFSKLIVELVTFHQCPDLMAEKIKSLIGYFDLDPNRVTDLILDVMELRLDRSEQFISLLKKINASNQDMCDLIGHKLSSSVNSSSDSIYDLIVVMVNNNCIDLASIYEHLTPSNDIINDVYKQDLELAKKSKTTNLPKLKEDDKSEIIDIISNDTYLNKSELYASNQKLRLCHCFLKHGNWENAKLLINWLPPFFAFRYDPIINEIFLYLHCIIEPLYSQNCNLPITLKNRRNPSYVSNLVNEKTTMVKSFQDLSQTLIFELTNYLGPLLCNDTILMNKLLRITQAFFYEMKMNNCQIITDIYQSFYNLLKNCLLPSLSLLNGHICLAEELWDAIKYLPFDVRYSLYNSWTDSAPRDEMTSLLPQFIEQKRCVQQQMRYILKRLSKENVKQFGRQIGKLCHCNPTIVFSEILSTVIMISSLVIPITDTFKYLGNLSLDVLLYSIISILASNKIRLDDLNQNNTINVLSTFCGLLCKRYQFDLVGLFQFILNKLKDGGHECAELQLVKEVIHKMTGIDIVEDMTDDQMEALCGGDLLRQEAGYFIQIRNVRKNSTRLKEILIEHNLAIPFVIMLSQERSLIFQKDNGNHLKVIGRLYDQCQDTMLQMMTFFSLHWSASEMVINCPSLAELLQTYNVAPDVAFFLNRTHFNYKVQELFQLKKEKATEEELVNEDLIYSNASQEIIEEYQSAVLPKFSQDIWDDFNVCFYTTFWILQTNDLKVPDNIYKKQECHIRSQIRQTEFDNTLNSMKKQKEIDRFNGLMDKLKDEQARCEQHVHRVGEWLNEVKARWFVKPKTGPTRSVVMTRFIELCVFPRVCFSSNDALFAAEIIYKLHRIKTPSFSTLICLDRIFNDITLMISTCSENEAKRYGLFMDAILRIVMRWHASDEIYTEECVAHPGFVTVFRKNTDGNTKADQLTYENYRHVLHKWHYRVTKSLVACLESENFIQIRNALIVLEKILNYYPKVQQFGQAIEKRVETLKEKEKDKRPDLHILTQSYHGHLLAKKAQWLPDKEFHSKEEPKKTAAVKLDKPTSFNGNGSTDKEKREALSGKRTTENNEEKELESKRRKVETNSNDGKKSVSPARSKNRSSSKAGSQTRSTTSNAHRVQ